ncbi:MAG: hypothetical protein ABIE07_02365 [Candidatus Zixiibacteriota bacterium]
MSTRAIIKEILYSAILIAFLGMLFSIFSPNLWQITTLSLLLAITLLLLNGIIHDMDVLEKYQTSLTEDVIHSDYIVGLTDCTLELLDKSGEKARYKKEKTIYANIDSLNHYEEKGFYFDGDFDLDSIESNCTHTLKKVNVENDNRYRIMLNWSPPTKKGYQKNISLSFRVNGAFKNDIEFFKTRFIHPIKEYRLRIKFPADRPVKDAWVDFKYQDKETKIEKGYALDIKDNEIIYKIYYARPGMESKLSWHW